MDRKSRQKINKEIEDLNNTTDQTDLKDVYRTIYSTAAEHIFFSNSQIFLQDRPSVKTKRV